MKREYNIYLSDELVGKTELEYADPPMGVIFGKITSTGSDFGYDFLKDYCKDHEVEIRADYRGDRFIATAKLPSLKVVNSEGVEIRGVGNQISGRDQEGFEISIEGVPYPLFETEFPEQVKAYHKKFE
ncbi:MAG: hypothetical protein KDD67_08470 [Ignavibacteriae bacterium]|nr:hypothetical protein [Ignavibacteriota bacterium]MCB9216701.1 hypothetical protein [Ignavibacteria bacterium]